MTAARMRIGRVGLRLGRAFSGINAIGAKELRGRMRGRRAFVVVTLYLAVLSGFAWMLESIQASAIDNGAFGTSSYASSQIGTTIFIGLLILETLLVLFLAPAFTAGAISLEREKQTLDLLVATPISSLSIVLGKLFSALAWVFLLVVASIPLTSLVFVFGGVAPEDLLRGYIVLTVEAIGLGCVGLFFSALLKRTLAATIASYSLVLAMTVGATFVWGFLATTQPSQTVFRPDGSTTNHISAPEAILWFNPFVADMDVLCPTGTGYGGTCTVIAAITGQDIGQSFSSSGVVSQTVPIAVPAGPAGAKLLPGTGFIVQPDGSVVANGIVADPTSLDAALGLTRDVYWPRSAAAWLVLSLILVFASVNLVSPTRRLRIRVGRPHLRRRVTPDQGGER